MRGGGEEGSREEDQRRVSIMARRWRAPWTSNGTSKHCTTCCSCGQVSPVTCPHTLPCHGTHRDRPNCSSSSVPTHRAPADANASPPPSSTPHQNPLVQQQRHSALRLALPQSPEEEVVVSRRGRGGVARLESPPPINRYAGDWSVCGQEFLTGQDADYDEVAGSESDAGKNQLIVYLYTWLTFTGVTEITPV